mgnify:CR=1 FL=1
MERRQIVMLVGIIILIIFLKFLNDKYIEKAKAEKSKTVKIIEDKGQVQGIAEKFDEGLKSVEEQTGNVFQNATDFVKDQVSNTTNSLTETVIKNTTQNIINQIEKLPDNNQTQIKELICK